MIWDQHRISLQKIEEEYLADMMKDDEDMYILKDKIANLSDLDRAVILIYADEQSMAKAAKKLGVSTSTIYVYIKKIREKLK